MQRKIFLLFLSLCFIFTVFAQERKDKIVISDDIELIKLTEDVYLHISYFQTQSWGKVGANGLLLVKDGEALMIDTPWDNAQTEVLYNWMKDSLHTAVTTVIPTHWHEDCMGGLGYLHSQGVKSYANQMTIDMASQKELPMPEKGFKDSLVFDFQHEKVYCYYLGGAHSTDNIVVYLPTEDILFGGCAVKDIKSKNLGNLTDADVKAWPDTMKEMIRKFFGVKIIVPGHGRIGDYKLVEHTLKLLEEYKNM